MPELVEEQVVLAAQQNISEQELIEMTEEVNSFTNSVRVLAEEFEVMYS